MNAKALEYYNELPPEAQREFTNLFKTDKHADALRFAVIQHARKGDFVKSNTAKARLDEYEAEMFAAYLKDFLERQKITFADVHSSFPDGEEKERMQMLSNKCVMYINLLDSAYQDLTHLMDKYGFAPQTIGEMARVGKDMVVEMRKIFGAMTEDYADAFDDLCADVDKLNSNKIVSFLRKQQAKRQKKGGVRK